MVKNPLITFKQRCIWFDRLCFSFHVISMVLQIAALWADKVQLMENTCQSTILNRVQQIIASIHTFLEGCVVIKELQFFYETAIFSED